MLIALLLGYKIRRARIEDAKEISSTHVKAWKESYEGIIDQAYLDNLKIKDRCELRQKILEENTGIHFVALLRGKVVGFCDAGSLCFHKNQNLSMEQRKTRTEKGEIYALYILKEHQNKGVGTALFQSARAKLTKQGLNPGLSPGLSPFLAWALKENIKARQFYENQGGILVDEIMVTIGDQEYPEVAYRFES